MGGDGGSNDDNHDNNDDDGDGDGDGDGDDDDDDDDDDDADDDDDDDMQHVEVHRFEQHPFFKQRNPPSKSVCKKTLRQPTITGCFIKITCTSSAKTDS